MSALVGHAPFTGREDELAAVLERIDAASTNASGVVLLSGEAGIGKSRLAAEVRAHAIGRGFVTLRGRCFETDRGLPYAPLLDLLSGRESGSLDGVVPALLTILPELAAQIPGIAPAPALEPEQEKRRLCQVFARAVADLAARTPMLLLIEDLHWCDEASLELLLYLARRLPARGVLVLLTYRGDDAHPALMHALAELDRARLATEIALAPLDLADLDALLRAIFGQAQPIRAEFLGTIHELTEGNPFFVEEVLKSLIAGGEIFFADGRWDRRPVQALRPPRTIADSVRRRVEHLSAATRASLTLAAVIGQRIDIALLAALTGHDETELLRQIKELIAAQLVVEESAEHLAFRHALTRQAVYAGLLARERRTLHRQVAGTLERRHAADLDAHLNELAHHSYQGGDWARALDYASRAGERAQARYAPRAAIEHFTRALDAAATLGLPPSPALLRARGQAYDTTGDFARAQADHEAALAAARDAGDRRAEWQALLDLGFLWAARDYARSGEYLRRALDLANDLGTPGLRAQSLNRLGNWYLNATHPHEARRYHEEALAIFEELGDRRGIAATLDLLGLATLHCGDLVLGTHYYARATDLCRELDDRRSLISSLVLLAGLNLESVFAATEVVVPALAVARQRADEAIAIARAIGWRSGEAYALGELASCFARCGEYGRALGMARACLAIATEIEHRQWMAMGHGALGGIYLELLAFPAAQRHLDGGLALAQETGSGHFVEAISQILAQLDLAQGSTARAEALFKAQPGPELPARTALQRLAAYGRAELALASGEPAQALLLAEGLVASAANLSATSVIPHLWLLRAEALVALGRQNEAAALLQDAQATARERGLLPLIVRIHRLQGQVYHALGQRAESAAAFAAARTQIEALASDLPDEPLPEFGIASLRAHFLQAALAQLPSPRPLTARQATKRDFAGLTARERDVATLIARGGSNRAIADQLTISERTVTTHITSILTKLGFTSRAQIAAWAVEHGLIGPDTH